MPAQRGQVMAFVAVALAVVLMPVTAYAIDSATASSAEASLQEATAMAAIEAVQQLDVIDFRAGGAIVVDSAAARRAAEEVLRAEAPAASLTSVAVSGAQVTVSAGEVVRLPFNALPTSTVRLEARASASLAAGYDRPSSRVPFSNDRDLLLYRGADEAGAHPGR